MPIDNQIALQVQTPNTLNTMGNMVNMASGMQNLKQGQMDLEERNKLRELASNLDAYKTSDGGLDLNKLVDDSIKTSPKLGAQFAQQVASAHAEGIAVNKSLNDLSEQQRGIIGQVVTSVADRPFEEQKKIIGSVIQANPRLGLWGDFALKHLERSANDPNALRDTALRIAKGTVGVTTQNELNTPNYVNTGGTLKQVNPMAQGGEITQTLPATTQTVDDQGNPVYVGNAPGGRPVAAGPKLGQVQTIEDAQKEVTTLRQAGDQVPMQRNINKQILDLSRNTTTGPGSQYWQKGMATIGLGQFGDNYQELGKFLEKNAIQQMQTMGGPPSDARLSAASAANGSTQFNPGALQAVTKFNDAATTALEKYRMGADKSVGMKNESLSSMPEFKANWAKNLDIDVFRVENAIRDNDSMELEKIKQELGPKRMKELAQKRRNLESLANTGKLP